MFSISENQKLNEWIQKIKSREKLKLRNFSPHRANNENLEKLKSLIEVSLDKISHGKRSIRNSIDNYKSFDSFQSSENAQFPASVNKSTRKFKVFTRKEKSNLSFVKHKRSANSIPSSNIFKTYLQLDPIVVKENLFVRQLCPSVSRLKSERHTLRKNRDRSCGAPIRHKKIMSEDLKLSARSESSNEEVVLPSKLNDPKIVIRNI
ncbi:unnamed protein product [Blepharisma stoltei]|uniref:PH domain-containing protein n=1 Tax=Blepharisma stoltei TaxID=1481888 RepID=A0AAU9JNV6_9CILI|nr:unnamed protein product [Blepharisma stoltei]